LIRNLTRDLIKISSHKNGAKRFKNSALPPYANSNKGIKKIGHAASAIFPVSPVKAGIQHRRRQDRPSLTCPKQSME